MNHLRLSAFICGLALCLSLAPAHSQAPVEDPFRYLEDASDPRTPAFFREQDAKAREALDRIPGRAAMLERIRALSRAETTVESVKLGGARVFYLKLTPERTVAALFVREGVAGAERLLYDPQSAPRASATSAIEGFSPSPDGRHVVLGVAEGGRGESLLRVLAVDAARLLPFEIDRAGSAGDAAWHPDGHSFFYSRVPESGSAKRAVARIYRHVLGRATDRDEIVFAPGVGGARDVPEGATVSLHLPLDSRYAYAIARQAPRREAIVHVAQLHELAAAQPRWRKIAGLEDEVLDVQGWRADLYVLSQLKAPRHRVLQLRGDAPDVRTARVMVPEGESVIEAMAIARDALYLRTMVGGVDRLERLSLGLLGSKAPAFVRIPFDNAIAQLLAHPRADGAMLRLEGWIEPPAVYQVDRQGELRRSAIQPAAAARFDEMDEVRLYAPSHDGVKVPVTLVYRKSTRLSGENPTLLLVYGAYGASVAPVFDATLLAWLERGGVLAIAHVRGGGEYGAAWHHAGRRDFKANSALDLVAAAQFLASYGFTRPGKLALQGTGAGAIAAAGAIARRPDLFGAAVLRAPLLDLVRADAVAHSGANSAEFGSPSPSTSPYHQLLVPSSHPAVMLIVGENDARVDPWHAAKMAAAMQAANPAGKPVLLRVEAEAGHPPAASRAQREAELADIYSFALWQLQEPGFVWPLPPPPPPPPAPEAEAPPPPAQPDPEPPKLEAPMPEVPK